MKVIKNIYTWLMVCCLGAVGLTTSSCRDEMAPENFFVFTGQMMDQYLKTHEECSKFAQIVERSKDSKRAVNIMDLIHVYGQYTCFAPTNDAIDLYMQEHGYADVESIPVDVCDTIARTHLINGMMYNTLELADFVASKSISEPNMNERQISIEYDYVIEDEDTVATTYKLNRTGVIDFHACNDTVANGIVHHIDRVLTSSTQTIADLMSENPNVSLFSQALQVTGIADIMAKKIEDKNWDYYDPKYENYHKKKIYSGAQWDMSDVPEHRRFKFTIFACPDSILAEKYGITDLKSFYDYAQSIYGGPEFDPNNMDALKELDNPLRRLVGYNCLPFAPNSYDRFTPITSWKTNINDACINPHEWFSTMDSLATIKVLRLMSAKDIRENGGEKNDLYLNRGDMIRSFDQGVHVYPAVDGYVQEAINGLYFYTDGLADYGEHTKNDIFNTRIRFDMMCLFPEFHSNNMRNYEPWNTVSCEDIKAPAKNWILPNGYLDGVKVNEDGIFLYQGARSWYWSYEGDEFNLCSDVNKYDIEFYLPSVPSGTYQIRLGFCAMDSRGICQFYLDGVPQGIPFDQRSTNDFTGRIGWRSLTDLKNMDEDRREAMKKNMHNNGWYHGPASCFTTPYVHKDGADALASVGEGNIFANQGTTIRYVVATANLDEHKRHKVRIKSIWAVGTALVMMDYWEMVPKSVYGVEGAGRAEDDY